MPDWDGTQSLQALGGALSSEGVSSLSEELHRDLLDQGFHDLAGSMDTIRAFVRRTWQRDHMPWFTNHGETHSRTVAEIALGLASPPYVHGDYRLNVIERYILWAGAWLHDVGMQRLLGLRLGDIDQQGYDRIRHEHPNESAELILQSIDVLGLPLRDRPLHAAISYVARAHGTRFFAESVHFMEQNLPSVRGLPFRGALLGALLLMADELDLGYERALALPDDETSLNTVSNAHALKHECVLSVDFNHGDDGDVGITLNTIQPFGLADSVMDSVERWILDKLRMQIARTELQIAAGFRGQVRFSRRIAVHRRPANKGPLTTTPVEPEPATLAFIEAENRTIDLINHRSAVRESMQQIAGGHSLILVGRLNPRLIDEDGREAVLAAVAAQATTRGMRVAWSDCLFTSSGAASADDVMVQLLASLENDHACVEHDSRERLTNCLRQAIIDAPGEVLLAISSLDLLDEAEADLVLEALTTLDDMGGVRVIFSGAMAARSGQPSGAGGFVTVDCTTLDRDGVAESLATWLPTTHATSEAAADDLGYSHFASLKLRHQQALV